MLPSSDVTMGSTLSSCLLLSTWSTLPLSVNAWGWRFPRLSYFLGLTLSPTCHNARDRHFPTSVIMHGVDAFPCLFLCNGSTHPTSVINMGSTLSPVCFCIESMLSPSALNIRSTLSPVCFTAWEWCFPLSVTPTGIDAFSHWSSLVGLTHSLISINIWGGCPPSAPPPPRPIWTDLVNKWCWRYSPYASMPKVDASPCLSSMHGVNIWNYGIDD